MTDAFSHRPAIKWFEWLYCIVSHSQSKCVLFFFFRLFFPSVIYLANCMCSERDISVWKMAIAKMILIRIPANRDGTILLTIKKSPFPFQMWQTEFVTQFFLVCSPENHPAFCYALKTMISRNKANRVVSVFVCAFIFMLK